MTVQTHAAYAEPIRDMGSRDLFALAKHVEALTAHPGWAALESLVGAHRDRLTRRITAPSLPSYEQIASLSGELRGLDAYAQAAETVLAVAAETANRLNDQLAETS